MEDQADFDTLTSMLDSDDDLQENTANNNETNNDIESSDDGDISDDELDRLALLAAEAAEENINNETDDSSSKTNTEEKIQSVSNNGDENRPNGVAAAAENLESGKEASAASELSEKDRMLFEMQEKIRLLEAQLSQKEQPSTETEKKAEPTRALQSKSSCEDKGKQVQAKNKVSTPKPKPSSGGYKEGSFSIFDVIDNEKKGGKKGEPVKQHTKSKTPPVDKPKRTAVMLTDIPNTNAPKVVKPKAHSFYNKSASSVKEKDLFGDTSDNSDWEDMDGDKPDSFNKSGQDIANIMKKKQRLSHVTRHEEKMEQEKEKTSSWSKPVSKPAASKSTPAEDIMKDPFSGIRIVKPLISSFTLRTRMEGRKIIRLSELHTKKNSTSLQGDWVTIGVIVQKSDPKMSSKGNQYSIWKLCDLQDCDKLVSCFLFGDTHKCHWKTNDRTVIGVLNPSIMQNQEKYQQKSDEVAITIDNPQKIMFMGTSKDMGTCKGFNWKSKKHCHNIINTQQGEFCTYHVQANYKKVSAKRAELQAGFTGVTPKSFEKNLFGGKKQSAFMYGGQSFSTAGHAPSKKQERVSITSLQKHNTLGPSKGKLSTLSVHGLDTKDDKRLQALEKAQIDKKDKEFHNLLETPSSGSLNFVRHLMKNEKVESATEKKKAGVKSASALELLKQHETEIKGKSKFYGKKKAPQLGRGLTAEVDIDLEIDFGSAPPKPLNDRAAELNKKRAAALISSKGGIEKQNPNAVKKGKTPDRKKIIEKRISEDAMEESTPPKKKSRLLGDLDLEDPEVQRLMNARSKHAGSLTEAERERQEEYFGILEKKEQMEEKMAGIMKQTCKAVTCMQCKYTTFGPGELCKAEKHTLRWHDAVKRFFKCRDCGHRTISLDKYPTRSCQNCQGQSFDRVSMLKEKKGPKLPHEELLLRGEERPNVWS